MEKTVPLFPLSFWHFWAKIYSVIFYFLIPIRKKTAFKNLQLAFPEMSKDDINMIIKRAYRNVITVIFEFFYLDKLSNERLNKLIKIINSELVEESLNKGKGLIIISAHFGNWELTAYAVGKNSGPINVIVKEQTNKAVSKRINLIRESGGNKMIDMRNPLREVLKALGDNKIVAMLSDQSAPEEGSVKVNFFVKDVPVFEGAAKFALKTGASVLFAHGVRQKDNSYIFSFQRIDTEKFKEYSEENIATLTQMHAAMLEDAIRKNPDHWLWFHRRFKSIINY